MARTGVFGGSFNPIHYGHLLMADQVQELLALDRMLFVPAAAPPHKAASELALPEHRRAMVALAIASHPHFELSDVELRRPGPSYTVDTLEALGAGGDELFLVIGSETFLDLLSWHAAARLARLARLVIVPRAGSAFDPEGAAARKVRHAIGAPPFARVTAPGPPPPGTLIVHALSLPISASELRARARTRRSLAYRLPPEVIGYIEAHGLYRDAAR